MANAHIYYDQQINFCKYLEVYKYNFSNNYLLNPLIPIYQLNKADLPIPSEHLSDSSKGVCNQIISANLNRIDHKPVNCVKMFSNSRKLLYGTANGSLVVCDIYNSFQLSNLNINVNASIRAMQFSKNESSLLTGDAKGFIHYYSTQSQNNQIKAKNELHPHNDTITDISFSYNNSKFVTSSDDRVSKIFDFGTGLEDFSFNQHKSNVKTCDWNPYRNIVASGGKDQTIIIWDPSSGNVIESLKPHKGSVNRLRFNKNGNWLLSASKDHLLKIIDIRIMKELQSFKGHETEVNTMTWHPIYEDLFCSAGADKNIIYWKVGQNKNYIMKGAHNKEIFDLCFNKAGTLLASGSNDSILKFWIRNPTSFK